MTVTRTTHASPDGEFDSSSSFIVIQLYVYLFTLHIKSPVISLVEADTSVIFVVTSFVATNMCLS